MRFNWKCPFCQHDVVITEESYYGDADSFFLDNAHGPINIQIGVIVCPNNECREFSFRISLFQALKAGDNYLKKPSGGYKYQNNPYKTWSLVPESSAKPFPAYIPAPLRQDYEEACKIRDLSPKASATLARRCLQGMIRDFWSVSKGRLKDEIEAIHSKVDESTWEAIDSVRKIGNIGAHMEKDIDLIVEVEPNEAALLIGLIEMLFEEWYMERHKRAQHLKEIKQLASVKEQQKKP